MSRETELLAEIRDLLTVIAEPALERQDANRRTLLRNIVGTSEKKARAVLLMDGTRLQAAISKESTLDNGSVSRLVKALAEVQLLVGDEKFPTLALKIPPRFFDKEVQNGF